MIEVKAWRVEFDTPADEPEWVHRALRDGRLYCQGGEAPYFTVADGHHFMVGTAGPRAREGQWLILFHDDLIASVPEELLLDGLVAAGQRASRRLHHTRVSTRRVA